MHKKTGDRIPGIPRSSPNPETLSTILRRCGIDLSREGLDRLWTYHQLLREGNVELNLTRIHNFENMVLKLYVDSILPGLLLPLPSPLLDLGTGPGMPGIPLKIAFPELEIILAEGRKKRVAFLEEVCARLGLESVRVVGRRISPSYDEPVRGVITRAVEKMADTLDRVEGCLEEGGWVVFMKGPRCDEEVETAVRKHAGRYRFKEKIAYAIPGTSHRRILVVFERRSPRPSVVRTEMQARGRHKVITSLSNPEYKKLRRILKPKGAKKERRTLVCGEKVLRDVFRRHGHRIVRWVTWQGGPPPPETPDFQGVWMELDKALYRDLDMFGTGGPLAVVRVPDTQVWNPLDGTPPGCTLLLPFQDPENVGAAVRSAAAFGVRRVVVLKEGAYPFHPKAVRASAGAVFDIPIFMGPSLDELPADLPVVALSREGRPVDEVEFPNAFGLLPGVEGPGLPRMWRDRAVAVPMSETVDSLNAAVAVSVVLYEWSKRRRLETPGT